MKHRMENLNTKKRKGMGRRLISLVLGLVMCCQLFPVTALGLELPSRYPFTPDKLVLTPEELEAKATELKNKGDAMYAELERYLSAIREIAQDKDGRYSNYSSGMDAVVDRLQQLYASCGGDALAMYNMVAATFDMVGDYATYYQELCGLFWLNPDLKTVLNSELDRLQAQRQEFLGYKGLFSTIDSYRLALQTTWAGLAFRSFSAAYCEDSVLITTWPDGVHKEERRVLSLNALIGVYDSTVKEVPLTDDELKQAQKKLKDLHTAVVESADALIRPYADIAANKDYAGYLEAENIVTELAKALVAVEDDWRNDYSGTPPEIIVKRGEFHAKVDAYTGYFKELLSISEINPRLLRTLAEELDELEAYAVSFGDCYDFYDLYQARSGSGIVQSLYTISLYGYSAELRSGVTLSGSELADAIRGLLGRAYNDVYEVIGGYADQRELIEMLETARESVSANTKEGVAAKVYMLQEKGDKLFARMQQLLTPFQDILADPDKYASNQTAIAERLRELYYAIGSGTLDFFTLRNEIYGLVGEYVTLFTELCNAPLLAASGCLADMDAEVERLQTMQKAVGNCCDVFEDKSSGYYYEDCLSSGDLIVLFDVLEDSFFADTVSVRGAYSDVIATYDGLRVLPDRLKEAKNRSDWNGEDPKLTAARQEYVEAELAMYNISSGREDLVTAAYDRWVDAAEDYYLLCLQKMETGIELSKAMPTPGSIGGAMPTMEAQRFVAAAEINLREWELWKDTGDTSLATTKRIEGLQYIVSLLMGLADYVAPMVAEAVSPFSVAAVEKLHDEIVPAAANVTKDNAVRDQLRVQIAQMQVWEDVAAEAAAEMYPYLCLDESVFPAFFAKKYLTIDAFHMGMNNSDLEDLSKRDRIVLKLDYAEAKALQNQMAAWLKEARDRYKAYDIKATETGYEVTEPDPSASFSYAELTAELGTVRSAMESAKAVYDEKQAVLDAMSPTDTGYLNAKNDCAIARSNYEDQKSAYDLLVQQINEAAKVEGDTFIWTNEVAIKILAEQDESRLEEFRAVTQELKAAYEAAAALLAEKKTALDSAKDSTSQAKKASDVASAEYNISTALMVGYYTTYQPLQEQVDAGTLSKTDEAYVAAKEAYEQESIHNVEASKDAAAKLLALEKCTKTQESVQKEYDNQSLATEAALQAYETQQQQVAEYEMNIMGLIAEVSVDYDTMELAGLLVASSNLEKEINTALDELGSIYSEWILKMVPAEDAAYKEKIIRYQELSRSIDRNKEDLSTVRKLLAQYSTTPQSVEEAEQAAAAAALSYYYAARDVQEFESLEYEIINRMRTEIGRGGVSYEYGGDYSYKRASSRYIEPYAFDYMAFWRDAVIKVKEQYDAVKTGSTPGDWNGGIYQDLYAAKTIAENKMNRALQELASMELRYELKLTDAQMAERKAVLQSAYDEVCSGSGGSGGWTQLNNEFTNYGKQVIGQAGTKIDNDMVTFMEKVDDGIDSVTGIITGMGAMGHGSSIDVVKWLDQYEAENYRDLFIRYTVLHAKFVGAEEGRQAIVDRQALMENQYVLQVNTGSADGTDKILFIAVVYEDEDGLMRKEYIFPSVDGYQKTMEQVTAVMNTAVRIPDGSADGVVNQDHISTMASLGQVSDIRQRKALRPFSSDYYLFNTRYKMATDGGQRKFLYFEAFGENVEKTKTGGKNEWALDGMRLYKVEDFFGLSAYGYGGSVDNQAALEFIGESVATFDYHAITDTNVAWTVDKHFIFSDNASVTAYPAGLTFTFDRAKRYFSTGKVGENSGRGALDRVSDEESEYLFKLDFSDVYGAGIESLINFVANTAPQDKTKIRDMGLAECLTIELVYRDAAGSRRQVKLPVVTSSIAWALDHGASGDDILLAYAQQDESLVFSAYLPEMTAIDEAYLRFERLKDWGDTSKASDTARSNITQRQSDIPKDTEIRLDGLQIYAPGTYTASARTEQFVVVPEVTGDPMYYMVAADSRDGIVVNYGTDFPLHAALQTDYSSSTELRPARQYDDYYMLVIHTDNVPLSSTTSNPQVEIDYTMVSGRQTSSGKLSVTEEGKNFYGYWPGINYADNSDNIYWSEYVSKYGGKYIDIMADQNTGMGGATKLLYHIPDVEKFDDIKITLPSDPEDDWQISGIEILKISSISSRYGIWETITKNGNFLTDRRYDRQVNAGMEWDDYCVWSYEPEAGEEKILIRPGETKVISIDVETKIDTEPDVDWKDIRYKMDETTAMSDLGFNRDRETYRLGVHVAGESNSSLKDGDCGSTNNFYFQLVFANGESGYILGNQQISGDGFRTGYIENLTIKTNRNYGELRAVRIIPDDISEDSNINDKLNIDSITISRQSDAAVNRTWVVDNVGWVGLDYHDEGEKNSVTGRAGRPESEIARSYPVSYATYSTKLLFKVSTGQVTGSDQSTIDRLTMNKSADVAEKIRKALSEVNQFEGEVSMVLYYRDTKGMTKIITYDMVGAMYDYAGKKVKTTHSVNAEGEVVYGTRALSDKSFMFRPGKEDRFEIEVEDMAQLTQVGIIARGSENQSTFWQIDALNVYLIEGSGTLNININDEYEKTYETAHLCQAINTPLPLWCPAQNAEEITFNLSPNSLEVEASAEAWEVTTPRVPDTEDDKLNIYVYCDNSKEILNKDNDLRCEAIYSTNHELVYRSAKRSMTYVGKNSSGLSCYATYGVDVSDISVLNKVSLSMYDLTKSLPVDHIVVQRIREEVVVATYMINAGVSMLGSGSYAPSAASVEPADLENSEQVVTLGFTTDTETARLIAENRDIAVALRYTSKNDNNESAQTITYRSPYIYLTDQQILAITSGGTAEITFHEKYLDEVKEVVLFATGGLKAKIDRASVALYEEKVEGASSVQMVRTGWYDIAPSTPVTLSAGESRLTPMAVTGAVQSTANPMRVTFVTANKPNALPSGPIRMTVRYTDVFNQSREQVFADIRDNLIQGTFSSTGVEEADRTAVIRVMLKDVKELDSLELAFTDGNADDTWIIDSMWLEYDKSTTVVGRGPYGADTLAMDASATYKVSPNEIVALTAGISVNSGEETPVSAGTEVSVSADDTVTLHGKATINKFPSNKVTVALEKWDDVASAWVSETVSPAGSGDVNKWTFTASEAVPKYRVTFSVTGHSEAQLACIVNVLPAEEPTE